jgi:N-methylhydantoinase B/oxoprolinase/acetone carboxylase alpha subunit
VTLGSGEIISIRTPGGGGYGVRADRDPAAVEIDRREERL